MCLPFLFGSRKKKFDAESLGVRFVPVQTFFFSATKNSKLELFPDGRKFFRPGASHSRTHTERCRSVKLTGTIYSICLYSFNRSDCRSVPPRRYFFIA